MAAPFKNISDSRVEFSLQVTKELIEKSKQSVLDRYRNQVHVKGFRPGKAPDEMIIAQVGEGKYILDATEKALDKAYLDFVREHKLEVIDRPQVNIDDKAKPGETLTAKVTVEIYPEIKVGDHKKIKVKQDKVEVTDQELEEVLSTAMAQLEIATKVDRKAKKGDMLVADFSGKDDKGEVIPSTHAEKHRFRIGMGHFLPDLEKAYEGMKAGETKDAVAVKFPKDYHSADMAGKTIKFDIAVHEVQEVDPSKLTEEQIEKMTGEKQTLDEAKEQIKATMIANKERDSKKKVQDEYCDELAQLVKVELPQSWIAREVDSRWQRLASNPRFKQDPAAFMKTMGKDEAAFKKDLAEQGEKDLRIFLGLKTLVEKEAVELDKDEMDNIQSEINSNPALANQAEQIILNRKIDKFLAAQIA